MNTLKCIWTEFGGEIISYPFLIAWQVRGGVMIFVGELFCIKNLANCWVNRRGSFIGYGYVLLNSTGRGCLSTTYIAPTQPEARNIGTSIMARPLNCAVFPSWMLSLSASCNELEHLQCAHPWNLWAWLLLFLLSASPDCCPCLPGAQLTRHGADKTYERTAGCHLLMQPNGAQTRQHISQRNKVSRKRWRHRAPESTPATTLQSRHRLSPTT
jgi:hypothetical protein